MYVFSIDFSILENGGSDGGGSGGDHGVCRHLRDGLVVVAVMMEAVAVF